MRGIELIKKYVSEGLSDAERFELEKLALDDDFLAAAWEGLSSDASQNAHIIISRLEKKIGRKKETKIVPIYQKLWPYVAAASLVFALIFLIPRENDESSPVNNVALNNVLGQDIETDGSPLPIEDAYFDDKTEEVASAHEGVSLKQKSNFQKTKSRDKSTDDLQVSKTKTSKSNRTKEIVMPIASPESLDQIPNSISAEKLAAMPEHEKPVPVPNDKETDRTLTNIVMAENVAPADNSTDQVNPFKHSAKNRSMTFAPTIKTTDSLIDGQASSPKSRRSIDYIQPGDELADVSTLSLDDSKNLINSFKMESAVTIDSIPIPVVGYKEYERQLRLKTSITREDLFMRNIRTDYFIKARLSTDENGAPKKVEILNLKDEVISTKLVTLIKSCGPWRHLGNEWIHYSFRIPIKK